MADACPETSLTHQNAWNGSNWGRPSMPWREVSVMDQRHEFVTLAMQEGVNRRELCRRFGISPDVGYKWLRRFAANWELSGLSRGPPATPGGAGGAGWG